MKADRDSLIYMAGIFDGEGHIGITEYSSKATLHGDRYKPETRGRVYGIYQRTKLQVSLGMVNREIPELFYLTFGGVLGKFKGHRNSKDQWRWTTSNTKALYFIEEICPHLRVKKAQAVIAIQFQRSRVKFGTHQTQVDKEVDSILVSAMHQLNRTGKELREGTQR